MFRKLDKIREGVSPFFSKKKMCSKIGISTTMYYQYLKGYTVPYKVIDNMAKELGLRLLLVKDV